MEAKFVCTLLSPSVLLPLSFWCLCLYQCLTKCIFGCVDLDSKACHDVLSPCLKCLYSSCFLLSEFDWIIQGFHFARAEVFIAIGPCLRHYTVTASSLKSLQQTNQFWGGGEGERKTTGKERCKIYARIVLWRLKQNGTLLLEILTLNFQWYLSRNSFLHFQNN